MRASRDVSSSAEAASLPEVEAGLLPELCPVGRAPLTGLPLELAGSTPEACDGGNRCEPCRHVAALHSAHASRKSSAPAAMMLNVSLCIFSPSKTEAQ